MTLDPRTPVLVGVGQSICRPDADIDPADRPEPLDLMVNALRACAEDVDGVAPGAASPAGSRLLSQVQRLTSVVSLAWRAPNPSLLVAERLGIEPDELVLTAIGGSTPQKLVRDAAEAIQAGTLDVAAVVGAEALYARSAFRRAYPDRRHEWVDQDPATTPAPSRFGYDAEPLTADELAQGVILPVAMFPLFENARRARLGLSMEEHRAQIGALWSSFSEVAATNPYAWITSPMSADEIMTPTESNRLIGEPYTKFSVANQPVDLGAGFLVCSLEAARAAGVREEAMVFPWSHAEANDHWFVSERPDLSRSVALEISGRTALELAGLSIDEIEHFDLYSCFPIAVALAADALGLPLDDPARPLTVTGGLTFAGGPGNNYVSHSIASMVDRLRNHPGEHGMVTGLGWYATKHAMGTYSTTPPPQGFRAATVQDQVDELPTQAIDPTITGPVTIETYTILHERDQGPVSAPVVLRNDEGVRCWGRIIDPETLVEVSLTELCGRRATRAADGVVTLD